MKKKLILAFVVAMCVSTANAQYGLGKLKDKAKDSNKKEEKKEEKKSTDSGKTETTSQTSSATKEATKEPEKKDPFGGSKYWTAEKANYYVADNGIITELHKNNIEKIVFSKTKLDPATATATNVTTTFNINDNIYGLVFMNTAMENYKIYNSESGAVKGNLDRNYEVRVVIDGKKATYTTIQDKIDVSKRKITCFSERFHCFNPGDNINNSHYFVDDINALAPGNHTIRLEVWGGNTNMQGRTMEPIAAGEFTLVKKAGDILKIGRNFSTVKAKKSDKPLETQMMATMKQYSEDKKMNVAFKAVKITSPDWTIEKNKYGVILGRNIQASAQGQDAEGKCYIYYFTFIQQYEGGGYQKTMSVNVEDWAEPIDCQ